MLVYVIVACEVGFWVLLALGLLLRYAWKLNRASVVVLASVPVVDLVLLGATVADLHRGGVATAAHGLAAAYIAFSVVFGHRTIRAVDQRVAHRWAGGPAPHRPPRTGTAAIREAWLSWGRAVLAWALACTLLATAIALIGDPERTRALVSWIVSLTTACLVWFAAGPLATTLLRRRLV